MLIHAWMYCSYYDRLLIMGDDMFIIAYEQAVIMHDQRHIHVIMNIIVNPTLDMTGCPQLVTDVGETR